MHLRGIKGRRSPKVVDLFGFGLRKPDINLNLQQGS